MPRYFMSDTRLAGLERMMMTPPRPMSNRADPPKKRPRKQWPHSQAARPCAREWEIKEEMM